MARRILPLTMACMMGATMASCGGDAGGISTSTAPTRANAPLPQRTASAADFPETLVVPGCYTVDPFKPIRIKRAPAGATNTAKELLGAWGNGAWEGEVCHDLWIMEVTEAGQVLMFDAHGPGFNPDATAFTRRGVITPEGRLRVRKGRAIVEYWVENGRLYGIREIGGERKRIIMTRKS